MAFSASDLTKLSAKVLAANVVSSNPNKQWYEASLVNNTVVDSASVWTQMTELRALHASNITECVSNAYANPAIIQVFGYDATAGIDDTTAVRLTPVTGTLGHDWLLTETFGDLTSTKRNIISPTQIPQPNGRPSSGYSVRLFRGLPSLGNEILTVEGFDGNEVGWFFSAANSLAMFADDIKPDYSEEIYAVGFQYVGQTGGNGGSNPLHILGTDGWGYHAQNKGTQQSPLTGDWREQLQAHPTIPDITVKIKERYNNGWHIIINEGIGSTASNGFSIWDGTEGFNYANKETPLQTLINIAPNLDGAIIGSTVGETATISNGGPYNLHFETETVFDNTQPLGHEKLTLPWDSARKCYYYEFKVTESITTIERDVNIYIDEDTVLTPTSSLRTGNLLPDKASAVQNVTLDEFHTGLGQKVQHGLNNIKWSREYPVEGGVIHYGFIQSNTALVLRGATLDGVFIPQFSRNIHECELHRMGGAVNLFITDITSAGDIEVVKQEAPRQEEVWYTKTTTPTMKVYVEWDRSGGYEGTPKVNKVPVTRTGKLGGNTYTGYAEVTVDYGTEGRTPLRVSYAGATQVAWALPLAGGKLGPEKPIANKTDTDETWINSNRLSETALHFERLELFLDKGGVPIHFNSSRAEDKGTYSHADKAQFFIESLRPLLVEGGQGLVMKNDSDITVLQKQLEEILTIIHQGTLTN